MLTFFDPSVSQQTGFKILSLNIAETKKAYKVTLLAPGLHRNDISVSLVDRTVTITNKKVPGTGPLQEQPFTFSTFTRTFTTLHPIDKDKIKMSYANNIISVKLVKKKSACRDLPLTMSALHPVPKNL